MLKWLKAGQVVRIRSVKWADGRMYGTFYTDMLSVPEFITSFTLPDSEIAFPRLEQIASNFLPVEAEITGKL